jgi:uncharacterized protein YjiS (DUF1127 family)
MRGEAPGAEEDRIMVSQNYARDAHEGSSQGYNWRPLRWAWITATEFWAAREAEQLLMAKSDSELKDIGVRRADIPRVVREGRLRDEDPVPENRNAIPRA